jgi:hypothetical protein
MIDKKRFFLNVLIKEKTNLTRTKNVLPAFHMGGVDAATAIPYAKTNLP